MISNLPMQFTFDELSLQASGLFSDENNPVANMANLASLIYWSIPGVNWAGFYLRNGDELILGPFHGKPACVRIPISKGVCGRAVRMKETTLVDDVSKIEDHIACDPDSCSEIVIPMFTATEVFGVLDLDRPHIGRFTAAEQTFLQECVGLLIDASAGWERYYFL